MNALNIILLRERDQNVNFFKAFGKTKIKMINLLTQVSNISSARSFRSVGLTAQKKTFDVRMKTYLYTLLKSQSVTLIFFYRLCSVINSTSSSSE